MGRRLVERRLRRLGSTSRRLREELRILDEQHRYLAADADDSGVRALVSESPAAAAEGRDAARHVERLAARREEILLALVRLEAEQDRLLDQLG